MVVWEKAPAKINLTLDVLGKRNDGYHDVEMIMTTIDLADRISFKNIKDDKILLETNSGIIPNDERNLVYQAADLIKSSFNIKNGVHIYLKKRIPVAAGLAGGSSDAAATLRGLNRLWNLNLTESELLKLGEQIGSDVPFCIMGGTAVARGRGEKLEKISSLPSGWVILAKLPISVSTSQIYESLDLNKIKKHPDTEKMIREIDNGNFQGITELLYNVLEEVTFMKYPQVKYLKEHIYEFGGQGVLMSGSGPTVFTLVNKENKAKRIYNALKGFCKEVYVVRLLK